MFVLLTCNFYILESKRTENFDHTANEEPDLRYWLVQWDYTPRKTCLLLQASLLWYYIVCFFTYRVGWKFGINIWIWLWTWIHVVQRIQYAKTKSDCVAKAEGSFVPREKKKKQEEKGIYELICLFIHHLYSSLMYIPYILVKFSWQYLCCVIKILFQDADKICTVVLVCMPII